MVLNSILEPIAIIGIGCRFPGANGTRAFWKLLKEGGDAIREVPPDRWDVNDLFDRDLNSPGKTISRKGGFIDHVDEFDWRAFRIPPREAKYMDPQHRLLLEVAWEALEDAGVPLEKVAGSRTGVFMGIMWNDYLRLLSTNLSELNGYSNTGNAFAFAPNRISYFYDLKGPSVAVDSACASSLVSVHYACQSLWLGETDMALAGGVNLMLSPDTSIMLSKAGVLSPDGQCKTLDAKADGFVRGEGAGILVLKPSSRLAPSDRVYAFIRGSAFNHNGHNEWIMAASSEGQKMAIRDAYIRAGINPAEIDYVELHGTGFLKGDAIEAKVLGEVLGTCGGRKRPCAIGSVKTNIGHLDSAAGIAGIIKVALSLYHQLIPPTLNLHTINPDIPLETLGLSVQKHLGSWPEKKGPNLAGVTAVAMSGVNAHVVLEGAHHLCDEPVYAEKPDAMQAQLLPLSACSPEALSDLVKVFKDFLIDVESGARLSLSDICYTACMRRSHHKYRAAIIGHSRRNFVESLDAFLQGKLPVCKFSGSKATSTSDISEILEKHGIESELVTHCLHYSAQENSVGISLLSREKEREALLKALSLLYTREYTLEWSGLYPDGGRCVQLPTYPWQRERIWLEWLECRKPAKLTHKIKSDEQLPGKRQEFLSQIKEAQPNDRRSILLTHIRQQVLEILGLDPSYPFKSQQRLFEAGFNSIAAVQLINQLQSSLGHPLPATLVFDYPTIEALSDYLAREVLVMDALDTSFPEPQDGKNREKNEILATLEKLTEDDAELLLNKKLEAIGKNIK